MTNPAEAFRSYLDQCPLVAIIRGVRPDEAEAIGRAIFDAGIRIIEVPLNSPDPLASIRVLAGALGDRALIGAAAAAGLVSSPGFFTPSEAFSAVRAGAHALKLFPAEAASPAVLGALLAVIPKHVPLLVVGGIKPDNMQPWQEAGAAGFGLGGGLYRAGQSAEETHAKARAYVAGASAR